MMPGPCIQPAAGAGVFDALAAPGAGWLLVQFFGSLHRRFGGFWRFLGPGDCETARQQLMNGHVKRTTRQHVIAHMVAGFLAALLAGAAGLKAYEFHPFGPLAIVIAAATWFAVMVLPQMHHFMGEGGQHFHHRMIVKVAWVERNLVGH